MKKTEEAASYFFVDESGDPTFYDRKGRYIVGKPGCSNVFMLGFVKTDNPSPLRRSLNSLRHDLCQDPSLKNIPSMRKTAVAFHAKDDCPPVKKAVFELLSTLNFRSQIIVGRKTTQIYNNDKILGQPNKYYDYLVTHLFKNVLHLTNMNYIYFAVRGNRKRQKPLESAIEEAKKRFEKQWNTKVKTKRLVLPQSPSDEPCLQIIDYVNWALYRAYTKSEMQYFNMISNNVSLVVDLFDTQKYPANFYSRRNPFDINKISPL